MGGRVCGWRVMQEGGDGRVWWSCVRALIHGLLEILITVVLMLVLTCYGGDCGALLEIPHSDTAIFIAKAGPFAWSRPERGERVQSHSKNKFQLGSFPIPKYGNQTHVPSLMRAQQVLRQLCPWKVLQSPEGTFHIHPPPSLVPASSTCA